MTKLLELYHSHQHRNMYFLAFTNIFRHFRKPLIIHHNQLTYPNMLLSMIFILLFINRRDSTVALLIRSLSSTCKFAGDIKDFLTNILPLDQLPLNQCELDMVQECL